MVRSVSRDHGKKQENGEDDEVYDALKHGSLPSAQGDHAEKQRQRQQGLILPVQTKFEGLPNHDRNCSNGRDRQANGRNCGSQR